MADTKTLPAAKTPSAEPANLRPEKLDRFLGQEAIKRRIAITLAATKSRGETLPHQLLAGPPGLGKTTLAQILAREMGSKIRITSGPSLEKPGDLAGTLVSLEAGDILFIDEIHRLSPVVEEFLYPALEDRKLDILVETDQTPRSIRIDLQPFTLIGATTKPGNLSAPLRGRFQTIHKMELYTTPELAAIVSQSAETLGMALHPQAADEIARRSRGTPRTANNHLLWIRDFASAVKESSTIDPATAVEALQEIQIDENGLDPTDWKILRTIVQIFKGGPVGLQSLAVSCGEDIASIEDMHEPYLISEGYIKRGPQGRTATDKAHTLVGIPSSAQPKLL